MSICPDVASRTAKATLKKSFGNRLLDRRFAEEDERLRSYEAASACANLADPGVLACERVRAAGPSPLALGVVVCERVRAAGPSPLALGVGGVAALGAAAGGAALLFPADVRERVRMAGPS